MLVVKGKRSSEMWKGSNPGLCGYNEWMQKEILQKNIMVTARKQLKETYTQE